MAKGQDDHQGNKLTTIKCRGRLVAANADEMRDLVKPLIPLCCRIVIDLGGLSYLDSSGLGTLLGLKVSAVKQDYCAMEMVNMTPRLMELLRITNPDTIFTS
jgi:anti-anti-sigma factor